jgi:hypothetical protein
MSCLRTDKHGQKTLALQASCYQQPSCDHRTECASDFQGRSTHAQAAPRSQGFSSSSQRAQDLEAQNSFFHLIKNRNLFQQFLVDLQFFNSLLKFVRPCVSEILLGQAGVSNLAKRNTHILQNDVSADLAQHFTVPVAIDRNRAALSTTSYC